MAHSVDANTIAYWPLDEVPGFHQYVEFTDLSSNQIVLTNSSNDEKPSVQGGPAADTYALWFSGSESIEFALSVASDTLIQGDLTLEFWIYAESFDGAPVLFSHGATAFALSIENDGSLTLDWESNGSPVIGVSSTGTLSLNTWTYVAITAATSGTRTVNFFFDAVNVGSGTGAAPLGTDGTGETNILGAGFIGAIAGIRLSSVARVVADFEKPVQRTNKKSILDADVFALWHINNPECADESGNGIHLSIYEASNPSIADQKLLFGTEKIGYSRRSDSARAETFPLYVFTRQELRDVLIGSDQEWTITIWFKIDPDETGSWTLFSFNAPGSTGSSAVNKQIEATITDISSDPTLTLSTESGSGTDDTITSTNDVATDNVRHMLSIVKNPLLNGTSDYLIYVDGSLLETVNLDEPTGGSSSAMRLFIGGSEDGSGTLQRVKSSIDDFSISNVQRDASYLFSEYSRGVAHPVLTVAGFIPDSLTWAYWSMDELVHDRRQFVMDIVGTPDTIHEITTADATNIAEAIPLLNEIKAEFNDHISNTGGNFHTISDSANTVISADATDDASAITLANELKVNVNAHISNDSDTIDYHPIQDTENIITNADASFSTTDELANELKADLNLHFTNDSQAYHSGNLSLAQSTISRRGFKQGGPNFDTLSVWYDGGVSNSHYDGLNIASLATALVADWTLELWLYIESVPPTADGYAVIRFGTNAEAASTDNILLEVQITQSMEVQINWANGTFNVTGHTSSGTLETRKWYYVANRVSESGGDRTSEIYINEDLSGTLTDTNASDGADGFFRTGITYGGTGPSTNFRPLHGAIGQIKLSNITVPVATLNSHSQSDVVLEVDGDTLTLWSDPKVEALDSSGRGHCLNDPLATSLITPGTSSLISNAASVSKTFGASSPSLQMNTKIEATDVFNGDDKNWTINIWYTVSGSASGVQPFAAFGGNSGNQEDNIQFEIAFVDETDRSIVITTEAGSGSASSDTTASALITSSDTARHMLTVVRSDNGDGTSNYLVYNDGSLFETLTNLTNPDGGDGDSVFLHIGGDTAGNSFDGVIDDISISEVERNATYILKEFVRGVSYVSTDGMATIQYDVVEGILNDRGDASDPVAAFTSNVRYKMRAVDSGRVPPGYIYWVATLPDFAGTQIGTAVPPLLGTASNIIQIGEWEFTS